MSRDKIERNTGGNLLETSGSHLEYLDGWRGLAILAVIAGHYQFVARFINPAPLGVTLFFVLSGRLMAQILFVRQTALPLFYQRRFARIYPALVALVAVLAVAQLRFPELGIGWLNIVTSLTFTYNYLFAVGIDTSALGHIWSLCVEEHAYVLLSVIAFGARRWGWKPVPIIAALAALTMLNGVVRSLHVPADDPYRVWFFTDTRVSSVLVVAAIYLGPAQAILRRTGWHWRAFPLAAAALGLMLSTFAFPVWIRMSLAPTALAFAVATIDISAPLLLRMLAMRPLAYVGMLSYSLYLWQQPITKMIPYARHPQLLTLLILAPAVVSFYLIERPCRDAINAYWAGLFERRRTLREQLA